MFTLDVLFVMLDLWPVITLMLCFIIHFLLNLVKSDKLVQYSIIFMNFIVLFGFNFLRISD